MVDADKCAMKAYTHTVPLLAAEGFAKSRKAQARIMQVLIGPDEYSDAFLPKVFEDQAEKLAKALRESLPGGTLDALLRVMLEHRASQLIVPTLHDMPKKPEPMKCAFAEGGVIKKGGLFPMGFPGDVPPRDDEPLARTILSRIMHLDTDAQREAYLEKELPALLGGFPQLHDVPPSGHTIPMPECKPPRDESEPDKFDDEATGLLDGLRCLAEYQDEPDHAGQLMYLAAYLRKHIGSREEELRHVRRLKEDSDKVVAQYVTECKQLDARADHLQQAYDGCKVERDEARAEGNVHRQDCMAAEKRVDEKLEEVAALRIHKREQSAEIRELRINNAGRLRRIDHLGTEIAELKKSLATEERLTASLQTKLAAREITTGQIVNHSDTLRERMDRIEARLDKAFYERAEADEASKGRPHGYDRDSEGHTTHCRICGKIEGESGALFCSGVWGDHD